MSYRTYLDIFCTDIEYLTFGTTFMIKVKDREPREASFGLFAHGGSNFTVTYKDGTVEAFDIDDDSVLLHLIKKGEIHIPYYIR
jgi:hypothetical protein